MRRTYCIGLWGLEGLSNNSPVLNLSAISLSKMSTAQSVSPVGKDTSVVLHACHAAASTKMD